MVSNAGKSFVRALELPEFETTLHFTLPSSVLKRMAWPAVPRFPHTSLIAGHREQITARICSRLLLFFGSL